MKYVYLLGTHDEYGSENLVATLDRTILKDLLAEEWPGRSYEIDQLDRLLKTSDENLVRSVPHDLSEGWGGLQFCVVKLR